MCKFADPCLWEPRTFRQPCHVPQLWATDLFDRRTSIALDDEQRIRCLACRGIRCRIRSATATDDIESQVRFAWLCAFGRQARPEEIESGVAFLTSGEPSEKRLLQFCMR